MRLGALKARRLSRKLVSLWICAESAAFIYALAESKQSKIDEPLAYIEKRLQEPEGEKEELREFRQNDMIRNGAVSSSPFTSANFSMLTPRSKRFVQPQVLNDQVLTICLNRRGT